MHAQFKVFRSEWHSWDTLFQQATEFLTTIGPDRTISVSHSGDGPYGIVTVWYWTDLSPEEFAHKS